MVSCLTLRLDLIGEENLIERLTCEWADSQLTIIHYFHPIKICDSLHCPLVSPISSQFWGLLCGDDHAYWEARCPGRWRDVRILFAADHLPTNPTSRRPLLGSESHKPNCFHISGNFRENLPENKSDTIGADLGQVSDKFSSKNLWTSL